MRCAAARFAVSTPPNSDPPAPRSRLASHGRRALIERGQADARDTLAHEANLPRGAPGKIDSAAVNERAAIVNPDHDRSPVVEVRHAHSRAHREATRGCGQSIFPEDFAAAGALAIETRSVPRSERQMTGPRRRCLRHYAHRPSREAGSSRLRRASSRQCRYERQPCICFCLKHPTARQVPVLNYYIRQRRARCERPSPGPARPRSNAHQGFQGCDRCLPFNDWGA